MDRSATLDVPPPLPRAIARLEFGAADAGKRLDVVLAAHLGVSRAEVQRLLAGGHVRLADAIPAPGARDTSRPGPAQKVAGGEVFDVAVPPPRPAEPAAIPLTVLYEDAALIVIDKPAGLVVHPAAGHGSGTLVNALIAHCGASLSGIGGVMRPGIVHRLDKGTSGVMVVAKTDAAHQGLARQFAEHGRDGGVLERAYTALVWGAPQPPRGRIDAALARSSADRQKIEVSRSQAAREATTEYATVAVFPGPGGAARQASAVSRGSGHPVSAKAAGAELDPRLRGGVWAGRAAAAAMEPVAARVECRLLTGRTHQVRVHLVHLGHPLIGDPDYASGFRTKVAKLPPEAARLADALGRQALHAHLLAFVHPTSGKRMEFVSPLPADLAALEAALAGWR